MKNEILYSPLALKDLEEINTYITNNLDNPRAAARIVHRIIVVIERLQLFPDRGTLLGPIGEAARIEDGYRFLVADNYMIFYRHLDEKIYVDRILYAYRNYLHILFDDCEL